MKSEVQTKIVEILPIRVQPITIVVGNCDGSGVWQVRKLRGRRKAVTTQVANVGPKAPCKRSKELTKDSQEHVGTGVSVEDDEVHNGRYR